MAKQNDQIGPYTLVSKLGRGAFGVVWLAEKRTAITTTKVAIKIPNDEDVDLEAVKQEASVWVHASGHPNVLPIIDADIHNEHVIIVSEYAPDGSLTKWLESHGGKAPSLESAVEMTLGILAGLEHLHERGVIHRDLKPDNILLQRETPRLADFGIARILKTTSKSTVATGTPAYMPPEAFDGKRSEQTDIWAVGVILYQLLSGRMPFPQEEFTSLVGAIITREPEPLPDSIPISIQKVVIGALKKIPEERYQSAGDMRKALREAVKSTESALDEAKTLTLEKDNGHSYSEPNAALMETVASPTQKVEVPAPETERMEPLAELASLGGSSTKRKSSRLILLAGIFSILVIAGSVTSVFIYRRFTSSENNQTSNIKQSSAARNWKISRRMELPKADISAEMDEFAKVYKISPDGKLLLGYGRSSNKITYILWDAQAGKLLRTINMTGRPYESDFGSDSRTIALADDKGVKTFDAYTGELKVTMKDNREFYGSGLKFSPDGKFLAAGSEARSGTLIKMWDAESGELVRTFQVDKERRFVVPRLSPDGKTLVGAGAYLLSLFNTQTGQLLREITVKGFLQPASISFSPDGTTIAGGLQEGKGVINLWDISTGELKKTLVHNNESMYEDAASTAFSPDGELLVTASRTVVKLWNLKTGELKQTFERIGGEVSFSSNGKALIVMGGNTLPIVVWIEPE